MPVQCTHVTSDFKTIKPLYFEKFFDFYSAIVFVHSIPQGSVTLSYVLLWQVLIANRPTKHRRISQAELTYIARFVSPKTKQEVCLWNLLCNTDVISYEITHSQVEHNPCSCNDMFHSFKSFVYVNHWRNSQSLRGQPLLILAIHSLIQNGYR